MNGLHDININTHVVFGVISLLLGTISLLSAKGGRIHKLSGLLFIITIVPVIITGLFGVFVFKRNIFLLMITLLSGYQAYSGYSALRKRSPRLDMWDSMALLLTILSAAYFIYYFQSVEMIWSPIIIYSTLGALTIVVLFDICKSFIPQDYYTNNCIWLHEHIYKMISAFSALLSAFTGTVLEHCQPHSQYLPSLFGFIMIIYFSVVIRKRVNKLI